MKSFSIDFFGEAEDPGLDDTGLVGEEGEIFLLIVI